MSGRLFTFVGGASGAWRVSRTETIVGEALPEVACIDMIAGDAPQAIPDAQWILRGITSNERYVERAEKVQLLAKQQGLGRSAATLGALIPIRKNAAWWALTQDERRSIFEAQSQHTQIGLEYLPAIARKLHHCRDLAEDAPFDFLTLFEFAPEHESAFNDLLARLRDTLEWTYVEREVDIRFVRS